MSIEDEAKEFANKLDPIKDIDCPRDIINPGLYFGYVTAAKKYEKEIELLKEEYEMRIENLEYELMERPWS